MVLPLLKHLSFDLGGPGLVVPAAVHLYWPISKSSMRNNVGRDIFYGREPGKLVRTACLGSSVANFTMDSIDALHLLHECPRPLQFYLKPAVLWHGFFSRNSRDIILERRADRLGLARSQGMCAADGINGINGGRSVRTTSKGAEDTFSPPVIWYAFCSQLQ